MTDASLVIAVASADMAAAALLFAIVQATAAFSQYLASMNRCSCSITGALVLRQGVWLYSLTLTPNPPYRMPVLTMPALRKRKPQLEQSQPYPAEPIPVISYEKYLNCYVDANKARISGPRKRELPIAKAETAASLLWRIILVPFALAACLVFTPFCIPCDVCYAFERAKNGKEAIENGSECRGFALHECALMPLVFPYQLFKKTIKRSDFLGEIEEPLSSSETPVLEPASWVQFLMNYQAAWWGHASLRWEWWLASMIPTDVYGATAETTVADLELLAIIGGMFFVDHPYVLAQTRCGEQLTSTQHATLGLVVS